MVDIAGYLADVIKAKSRGGSMPKRWFKKLAPFFDRKFGPEWEETHRQALEKLNLPTTREELEDIL